MVYKVFYKSSVKKDLEKIPKIEVGKILIKIENELSKNAESYSPLKGKFAGLRRIKIGVYRAVFAIVGEEVFVLRIGHRSAVYKGKS